MTDTDRAASAPHDLTDDLTAVDSLDVTAELSINMPDPQPEPESIVSTTIELPGGTVLVISDRGERVELSIGIDDGANGAVELLDLALVNVLDSALEGARCAAARTRNGH